MTTESKPMSEAERLANDYQATCFSVSGGESPYHVDAFIAGYEACAKSKDAQIAELLNGLNELKYQMQRTYGSLEKAKECKTFGDMHSLVLKVLAKYRGHNK